MHHAESHSRCVVLSLTLTYLMQVYSALQQRNTLGLKINLMTAESGDAADLIAGLGPDGQFSAGYANLATLADDMTRVKESHHFYPVLFYFRFHEPEYSVSRMALAALDMVTLNCKQQSGGRGESARVPHPLTLVSKVAVEPHCCFLKIFSFVSTCDAIRPVSRAAAPRASSSTGTLPAGSYQ